MIQLTFNHNLESLRPIMPITHQLLELLQEIISIEKILIGRADLSTISEQTCRIFWDYLISAALHRKYLLLLN